MEGQIPTDAEVKEFCIFSANIMMDKLKRFRENRTTANYLELQDDVFLNTVVLNTKREKDVAKLRLDDIQISIWRVELDPVHTPRLAHAPLVFVITTRGRGLPYKFVLNPTPPPPPPTPHEIIVG